MTPNTCKSFSYNGETLVIIESKYEYNGNLALLLYTKAGEPYATITVNIAPLDDPLFALDVNNLPEDLVDTMVSEGIIEPARGCLHSGWVDYPIYRYKA